MGAIAWKRQKEKQVSFYTPLQYVICMSLVKVWYYHGPTTIKDQKSLAANSVKRQIQNLSVNINVQSKPVFQTKKIGQVLASKEKNPYC